MNNSFDTLTIVVSAGLAVIGFFLIRFFYLVDEIRKDVKELLINRASQDHDIKQIREEIHDIKTDMGHFERKVQKIEVDLSKFSK